MNSKHWHWYKEQFARPGESSEFTLFKKTGNDEKLCHGQLCFVVCFCLVFVNGKLKGLFFIV